VDMLLKLTVLNTNTKSTNFWSNIYLFKIQNIIISFIFSDKKHICVYFAFT